MCWRTDRVRLAQQFELPELTKKVHPLLGDDRVYIEPPLQVLGHSGSQKDIVKGIEHRGSCAGCGPLQPPWVRVTAVPVWV